MTIYLSYLLAITITCKANEVSWNRQVNAYSRLRGNDLNRRAYLDEAGGRSDRNNPNRADGLSQVDYARRNSAPPVPVVRSGNYLNNLDGTGQKINVERTSYYDKSTPIARAGNYGNVNNAGGTNQRSDVTRGEPRNDISRSNAVRPDALMSRRGYNLPVPEIYRKQLVTQYASSVLDTAERSAIDDSINKVRDTTFMPNKDFTLPSSDHVEDYNLLSEAYESTNDGYDVYGINEVSEMNNQSPNNGYGGLDYSMLAPDFDNFLENDVNSLAKNKKTNSAAIATYNEITDLNIDNSTDKQVISDRVGFFDDDSEYNMDHRGFHNTLFSDDNSKNVAIPEVVEISSYSAPMSANNECYCSTNNGHRVCHNCDHNHHCDGANCHRVTTKTHTTTTTTCDICKQPPPPPPSPPPFPPPPPPPPPPPHPPRCECCEPCRPKCDPCKQRESSRECKQSCGRGCNCCKTESSCCKKSCCCKHISGGCGCKRRCHSCRPKKPCNCESGQNFDYGNDNGYNAENGHNYNGDNGNSYNGNNGNNYNGDNGNNNYAENANHNYAENKKAYDEYYKNYYSQHEGAAFSANAAADTATGAARPFTSNTGGVFAGNAGGQYHVNVQGGAFAGAGAYAGGGGSITHRGSETEEFGSSGGTVALFSEDDMDDNSVSSIMSSSSSSASTNAGSSISNLIGNSKSKANGITKTTVKITTGSIKTGGSNSGGGFSSSTTYGSNGSPYNQLFSSFGKTGLFGNHPLLPGSVFGG